jgi:hypothetical protein
VLGAFFLESSPSILPWRVARRTSHRHRSLTWHGACLPRNHSPRRRGKVWSLFSPNKLYLSWFFSIINFEAVLRCATVGSASFICCVTSASISAFVLSASAVRMEVILLRMMRLATSLSSTIASVSAMSFSRSLIFRANSLRFVCASFKSQCARCSSSSVCQGHRLLQFCYSQNNGYIVIFFSCSYRIHYVSPYVNCW